MQPLNEDDSIRSIALYCRVSTDEQAREGVSLDEQQARLKAYCRAMGWDSEITLYVDDGYSAKNMDRPKIAPRAKTSPHLLGGILKCGKCGASMSIGWSGSKNKRKVAAYTAGLIELDDLNEEKIKMEKIIETSKKVDEKPEINIERLEKQLQKQIQSILQAIDSISITEAKAFLQTIIEKVTILDEKELEIEFHRI